MIELFHDQIASIPTNHDFETGRKSVSGAGAWRNSSALQLCECTTVRSGAGTVRVTALWMELHTCELKTARYLPGPTVQDEIANAAFFVGLMVAGPGIYGDITRRLSFDAAKENFSPPPVTD